MARNDLDLDALIVRDDAGVSVVSFGLVCTLYVRRPLDADGAAIKELINRYADLTKHELRWLMPTRSGARPLGTAALVEELGDKLASLGGDDGWEIHLHGGAESRAASNVGLEIVLRRRWEAEAPHNHLSFVSFRFPLHWFDDNPPGFVSFVASVCDMLQPVHGYAGIGVVTAADRFVAARFENAVASLADRFPGLEIDYPVKHLLWVRAGLKGVNWLTVAGDELLGRIGSLDELRAKLPADALLHGYRGGTIIQASPEPLLGESDVGAYRAVAKALAPIRISMHSGVHGSDALDRTRFERWLARFD